MRLRVFHTIRYRYPTPASASYHEVRLMPCSDTDQTCLDFRLTTAPPAPIFAYDLPTGRVHHFSLRSPHSELTLTAEALVVTHHQDPFASLQRDGDDSEFYARENVRQRYAEYLAGTERVPMTPDVDRIAAIARREVGVGTASFLILLTRLLHRAFTYALAPSPERPPAEALREHGRNLRRDFLHLMLAVCRRQGIPARYVSGYFYPDGRRTPAASTEHVHRAEAHLETEERAQTLPLSGDAMHAWIECLLPDERWHGFDPIQNLLVNDTYIKTHFGRDYADVMPVRGIYRGPRAATEVSVRILTETQTEP